MKRTLSLIAILAFTLILGGCAAMFKSAPVDPAQAAETQKMLESKSFTFNASNMMPLRGGTKFLDGRDFFRVEGDDFTSALPFIGRAFSIPYGGGEGLSFESKVSDYRISRKGDHWIVTIKVETNEDNHQYRLEVYADGNAYLTVSSRERDTISFNGGVTTNEK